MEQQLLFTFISVVLALVGYGLYYFQMYSGVVKPHRYTWFLWFTLTAIGTSIGISSGAGSGILALGLSSVLSLGIFIISLRDQSFEASKGDKISLVVAAVALALWPITSDPILSIVLIAGIDIVGYIPTVFKSIKAPHSEPALAYFTSGAKYGFVVLALETMSFTTWFYPIALMLANFLTAGILIIQRNYDYELFIDSLMTKLKGEYILEI